MAEEIKKGVVLMNLGSPDSTSIPDVKKYLDEFLMDDKVMDYPWLFRALLVKGIIIPFRAPKSAEAYKSVWTEKGSPLIEITRQLRNALASKIPEPVSVAMRYGNPSPKAAFDELMQQTPDLKEVVLVPLYPHYAMSSYRTAVDYAREVHQKYNYPFKLDFIKPFYDNEDYLHALTESIRPYLQKEYDHILFSYHGVPERHIRKDDITQSHCLQTENCCTTPSPAHKFCYRHQCFQTTADVVNRIGIPKEKYSISFQSRLGKGWLQPFTDKVLATMPQQGIKKLLVVCPAFVSDCLETIEEIAEEGKEIFMHAGGESFEMIPCMNVNGLWVQALERWVSGYRENKKVMLYETPKQTSPIK